MRNLTRAAMILATAALAGGVGVGCGGDDDGSGGDFSTGLSKSKLLSEVTAEEAASACENLQSAFETKISPNKIIRATCTLIAAATAENKADCETARDACIDQASDAGADIQTDYTPECNGSADLAECQGTVGELETCLNDTFDLLLSVLDRFSCDDAGTIDEEELGDLEGLDVDPPASCAAVQCADDALFGSDEQ